MFNLYKTNLQTEPGHLFYPVFQSLCFSHESESIFSPSARKWIILSPKMLDSFCLQCMSSKYKKTELKRRKSAWKFGCIFIWVSFLHFDITWRRQKQNLLDICGFSRLYSCDACRQKSIQQKFPFLEEACGCPKGYKMNPTCVVSISFSPPHWTASCLQS